MKPAAIIFVFLLPAMALAQNYQGMSEQDMQRMMQQMQQAGACMQSVDQGKLNALEQQARGVEADVKSLCASGQRDQAQSKALSFARQMMADPTVKAMRKCGEMMKGMMPPLPFDGIQNGDTNRHVCD